MHYESEILDYARAIVTYCISSRLILIRVLETTIISSFTRGDFICSNTTHISDVIQNDLKSHAQNWVFIGSQITRLLNTCFKLTN